MHLFSYELRLDGFTYATVAPASEKGNATLITKPLHWHGGELAINADTTPTPPPYNSTVKTLYLINILNPGCGTHVRYGSWIQA